MEPDADVLVVGTGPVGLLALTMLGQSGLRAVGIDRQPVLWNLARAVHFDDEVLRIFQSVGLGEQVAGACSPMRDYRFENEAGEDVVRVPFPVSGPQGWPIASLFHQPDIDKILHEAARACPSVELRPGQTLTGLAQEPGLVRAQVSTSDGAESEITARWVIAADGATSTVRKLLDVTTENLGSDEPWLVADGVLRGETPMTGDMVVLGRHSRPGLWLNLPNGRARLELKVLPDDDPAELATPAGVAAASRGLLTDENFTPDRIVVYTFRSRLATRWRVGGVFLAGDSAHLSPPLFGQGLCAGLRDVANLVWKLRAVAAGLADDELLDTYESERLPHARYWVEQSTTMAEFAQTTDPVVAGHRDAHLRADPGGGVPRPPALGPGLHQRPAEDTGPVGKLAAQPVLADGRLLDELVGWRFLVAVQPALAEQLDPAVRAALDADPEVALLDDAEQVGDVLAAAGSAAVVVRPDRYVLGLADTAGQLAALLELLPTKAGAAVRDTHSAIA